MAGSLSKKVHGTFLALCTIYKLVYKKKSKADLRNSLHGDKINKCHKI